MRVNQEDIVNDWLRAIYKREEYAFKLLFYRYYPHLVNVASKVIENSFVEDVVQEVFLKLWQQPVEFKTEGHLRKWLYISTFHGCLNVLRQNKIHSKYLEAQVGVEAFEEVIMEEEVFVKLTNCIDQLPEKYRQIIEASLQGHSNAHIAETFSTTVDAIKSYKKRATSLLKAKFHLNEV